MWVRKIYLIDRDKSQLIHLRQITMCLDIWYTCQTVNNVTSSFPSFTCSLRKWNLVSICLLLPWETRFLDKLIADCLSTSNLIALSTLKLTSFSNELVHLETWTYYIVWQLANKDAIYSASQEDKDTASCFLEH